MEEEVVLTRVGSWAPQGLSSRQAAWQVESPLQAVTHWLPNCWHSKKGIVCENWDALGERPLPQMQVKSSVVCGKVG